MQITEFNFIIDFFQRGVVHILKRCLAWYVKVRRGKKKQQIPITRPDFAFPFLLSPQNKPTAKHTLRSGTWVWRNIPMLWEVCEPADKPWAQPGPRVQQCTGHLQVREGGARTWCSLPPNLFQLKNTRCSNPKLSCLQESLFDCRCFIFLFYHTSHSWPCAIIAWFSLKSSLCCYLHSGLRCFDHWAICNKRLPR